MWWYDIVWHEVVCIDMLWKDKWYVIKWDEMRCDGRRRGSFLGASGHFWWASFRTCSKLKTRNLYRTGSAGTKRLKPLGPCRKIIHFDDDPIKKLPVSQGFLSMWPNYQRESSEHLVHVVLFHGEFTSVAVCQLITTVFFRWNYYIAQMGLATVSSDSWHFGP